jgi:hypothetical protein
MAEDLSDRADGSLTAGSMAATNMISDPSAAMTAPGSASESTRGVQAGAPELAADPTDARQTVHGAPGGDAPGRWEDVSGRRDTWAR